LKKIDLMHYSQWSNDEDELADSSSDLIEIGIDLKDFQPNHEWDIVIYFYFHDLFLSTSRKKFNLKIPKMSVPAQRIVPQHHSEEQNDHIAPKKYQQQREPVVAITFNLELRRKTLVIFFFINKANSG
jgi:hypothetical protein